MNTGGKNVTTMGRTKTFVYDTEQTRAQIVCVYNNTDSICMQQHIHVIMGMDVKMTSQIEPVMDNLLSV